MAYQFQVKGGSQKPWKQQLMLALEKQATLSYQRAHPESLKKQAEQDTEAALRRRRFGIAMTIVGAVLAVIGLMDLKEQWVVALVSLPFLAWGIAHLLPKPKYRRRYRRAAKILTKQRQNMPETALTFTEEHMAFEDVTVDYDKFDMVIATEDLLLLTWDDGHIIYVPKQDMTEGDPVELIRFLNRKIGKKVIKM